MSCKRLVAEGAPTSSRLVDVRRGHSGSPGAVKGLTGNQNSSPSWKMRSIMSPNPFRSSDQEPWREVDKGFPFQARAEPGGCQEPGEDENASHVGDAGKSHSAGQLYPKQCCLAFECNQPGDPGFGLRPEPGDGVVDSETTGITTGNVLAASPTSLTVAVSISPSVTADTTLRFTAMLTLQILYMPLMSLSPLTLA